MEQIKILPREVNFPTAEEPIDRNSVQDSKGSINKEKIEPLEQLEGFQLFGYFTANIIKQKVIFTR